MPSLIKKKADAVLTELKKSENAENAQKEHVLATYSYIGKSGRKILRFEGTNEFGTDIYYDYVTKKTGSLEVLAKYWGVTNLKTDKIDLKNAQIAKDGEAPQTGQQVDGKEKSQAAGQQVNKEEKPQEESVWLPLKPQNKYVSSQQNEAPNTVQETPSGQESATKSGKPGQQKAPEPKNISTAQEQIKPTSPKPRTNPDGQTSVTKPKLPAPNKILKAPEKILQINILPVPNPPSGAPVLDKNTKQTNIWSTNYGPLFQYYSFTPETIHCASFAIGGAFSTIATNKGRCNTFMPVSSWKLADQMKMPEYTKMFKSLNPAIKSDADLVKFMTDEDNKLPVGTLLTLRAVETHHTEIPANKPTHTMVYLGAGVWTDNTDDESPRYVITRETRKDWKEFMKKFPKYFKYVENSGAYAPVMENFPKAVERLVSLSDFGLQSETPEKFATLISQTYHIPFEIAFNSIMVQNNLTDARENVSNLSVQINVPEIYLGKQNATSADWAKAPTINKPDLKTSGMSLKAPMMSISPTILFDVYFKINGKLKGKYTQLRVNDFVKQCKEIDRLGGKFNVDRKDTDGLKVILFNENYSSDGVASGRLVEKKIALLTNVNKIHSYGMFQCNIDYARKFLADKNNREAFIALFQDRLGNDQIKALNNLNAVGTDEQRKFIADELLTDLGIGLFFANKLYRQNKSIIVDNARKYVGQGESAYDLEFTTVFCHNRGIERTNTAIFQQNLLITAENMLGQARFSQYHSQIRGILEGYKIDGSLKGKPIKGVYPPSKTFELFTLVCKAYGISEISANGGTYFPGSMSLGGFDALFGKNATAAQGGKNNYQKMAEFFSLPQFAPPKVDMVEAYRPPAKYTHGPSPYDDYASSKSPYVIYDLNKLNKPAAPDKSPVTIKPCLDFNYLKARKTYLTGYLTNYLAFVAPSS
ncbi:MAG: hypothetical protein NT051_01725 [Candidatus Micrarchaeota archaeon]|nr:hypothetical protein [Candidatus Micrarchaeota archaeon]